MTFSQAFILGIVQGLTEFLPISSSAHLILVPWFLGWKPPGLAFDVALHWGTLLGVVVYFRTDLTEMTRGFIGSFKGERAFPNRLPWLVILGTIPAGLIGLAFEKQAETIFRSPWVMVGTLSGVGLLLLWTDKKGAKNKSMMDMSAWQAFLIGAAQGLAIVPGVSRSGITMTVALFLALTRHAAVRFSFLLSIPIILAAGLLKIDFIAHHAADPVFLTGFAASALSGYAAVSFLLKFVKTKTFVPFVIYRIALAGIILLRISGL